jgi:hypothetical protein
MLGHDRHTGVVAAVVVDTVVVVSEPAYLSHDLVVVEQPISAAPAAPAAEVVVDQYKEPTKDFSVY